MTDGSDKSFGRYLKSVRLEKGISLDEIAAATRIVVETLLYIEDEDHEKLPAAVFVKGFIRSYAKTVGADSDLAIQGYEKSGAAFRATAKQQSARVRSQQVFWPRLAMGLLLLAVIALGSVFALSTGKKASHEPPAAPPKALTKEPLKAPHADPPAAPPTAPAQVPAAAEKTDDGIGPTLPAAAPSPSPDRVLSPPADVLSPAPETPPPAATAPLPTAPPPDAPPPVVPVDLKQRLFIDTVEQTWMKVVIDDVRTVEYMLKPGDHLQLEAEKGFNLLIGNAAGIAIKLNGKTVPIDGKRGQVVTVQLP